MLTLLGTQGLNGVPRFINSTFLNAGLFCPCFFNHYKLISNFDREHLQPLLDCTPTHSYVLSVPNVLVIHLIYKFQSITMDLLSTNIPITVGYNDIYIEALANGLTVFLTTTTISTLQNGAKSCTNSTQVSVPCTNQYMCYTCMCQVRRFFHCKINEIFF